MNVEKSWLEHILYMSLQDIYEIGTSTPTGKCHSHYEYRFWFIVDWFQSNGISIQ